MKQAEQREVTRDDFNKSFAGSYLLVQGKPAKVTRIEDGMIYGREESGRTIPVARFQDFRDGKVVFPAPVRKYINHEGVAVFVTRKNQRQWRKGINRNTVGLSATLHPSIKQVAPAVYEKVYAVPLSYTIISSIMASSEFSFHESLENVMVETKTYSAAISPNFALSVPANSENLGFHYRNILVGELTPDYHVNLDAEHKELREVVLRSKFRQHIKEVTRV